MAIKDPLSNETATHFPRHIQICGVGFLRLLRKANDFAAPISVGGHSDYGGYRDDPPALSLLEIGGVRQT